MLTILLFSFQIQEISYEFGREIVMVSKQMNFTNFKWINWLKKMNYPKRIFYKELLKTENIYETYINYNGSCTFQREITQIINLYSKLLEIKR